MESRVEIIWTDLASLIEERRSLDLSKTSECFNFNREQLLNAWRTALHICYEQSLEWQKKGEKGETDFIAISFLDTSILTRTYDLRIDFYDKRFFCDIAESCAYLSYIHLNNVCQESTRIILDWAHSEFSQIRNYEENGLAWRYQKEVLYVMVRETCDMSLQCLELLELWSSLSVSDNCIITYGRMLDNHQPLMKVPKD